MKSWIEAAIEGKAEAQEQLMKQYRGMALAVARRRLGSMLWAEDVVQEAFAEAFANLGKLDKPEAFPGWFKVIVERQCHRHERRKQHTVVPITELLHVDLDRDSRHNPEEQALLNEKYRSLHDSIDDLPSALSRVVHMFYFQGYSLKEISDALNVSVSALKKRLYDARAKLRHSLPVTDMLNVFNELYEGGKHMLHITNGDHAADRIRQSGIQGEVVAWRELYTFGPVFPDMSKRNERARRADYLEAQLGIPKSEYMKIRELEQKLDSLDRHREVVLWFEYDLYDQTMLSYLLHVLHEKGANRAKLHLLCLDSHPEISRFRGLGQLTPVQIERLSGTWHVIEEEEMEAGRRFWEAYVSPDPQDHARYLLEDKAALPYAQAAFQAHLSRLPSTANGLGMIEQKTLEIVKNGTVHPFDVFQQVSEKLHLLGLGDLQYWAHLRRMADGPHALLHVEGANAFPNFRQQDESFRFAVLALTELGERVLHGERDGAALWTDEWWIGGIMTGAGKSSDWRWDPEIGALVNIRGM